MDLKGRSHGCHGPLPVAFPGCRRDAQERQAYKDHVARGLNYLKSTIKPNGQFPGTMYSQGIATVALCEAAGMTNDESVKKVAKLAIDYIIQSQGANGSWGYVGGEEGDTLIVGWQIQALKRSPRQYRCSSEVV